MVILILIFSLQIDKKKTVCRGLIPSFLVLSSDSKGRDNDSSKVSDIAVIKATSNVQNPSSGEGVNPPTTAARLLVLAKGCSVKT